MNLQNFYKELDLIFKTGNVKLAEKFIVEHMELAQKEEDVQGVLAAANEIGGIYRVTGRFEEAKNSYEMVLESIKIMGLQNTEQHGTAILNLAAVYAASKNNQEALRLYLNVAKIFNNIGLNNDYRMAALYNNISHVYEELSEYSDAEKNAEKALKIIKDIPNSNVELGTTYTTVANIYIKQQRFLEAEKYLCTSEKIFQDIKGKTNVRYSATLNSFGELYFHMKDYIKAIDYLKKSLQIVVENYGESNMSYVSVCKNIALVYKAIGEIDESLKYDKMADNVLGRIKNI